MSIFDAFLAPEARSREPRSNSDIKVEQQIKIQDSLRTDPTSVKRYWSDVPEDFYQSEQYKAYCQAFKASETLPMALNVVPGTPGAVVNKRIMEAQRKVTLEKNWLEQQKSL